MNGPDTLQREQIRLDALRRYDVLGAFGEPQFDDVAQLAAHLCQTPMAGITAIDASRKWFIASHGLDLRETTRDDAFCLEVVAGAQPQMLVVSDALEDPRFAHNTLVTGHHGVRFYVGAPLVTAGGEVLGALCAMDRVPRTLTATQLQSLDLLGRHVITQLEARRNLLEADKVNRALLSIVEDEQLARTAARTSERQMREINERFQAVVQATNDAVRDWDVTNNALWWSEGAETQFGLGNAEAAEGIEAWRSRIHPDDRRRVSVALDRALRSQVSTWLSRYRFRRSDGAHAMVADRGRILRASDGKAVRVLAGMRDISDLNELEEQLRQAQRLEAIGQLTGGVAHDFNNLLTVMLGNAEVLKEELEHQPRHQMMADMIATAAQRAAELTQRLLAFARRQLLSPEAVDVNTLIEGMRPLLSRAIAENIEIVLMPGANLPSAMVDPAQLESALLNLCINARDAMPRGGRLTVLTEGVELDAEFCSKWPDLEPGHYIRVSVSDTGEGIPPENMARLFEPFFTTKEKGKGTGLGLPMVYGFVKQSGGHVTVTSKLGQGTVVRMDLPRTPDDVPSVMLPILNLSVPRGTEDILLVEDDPMVRGYLHEQLQSLGYQVQLAPDGVAALKIIKGSRPIDLLLTDMMMPGMSGSELAEAALHVRPGLKVLFCSGYSEEVALNQGRLEPGVELLSKPFRRGELARRVREVLDANAAAAAPR